MKRLNGLMALKGLACVGIFASHASKAFTSFGAMGVSLFLILSGFGMIYGYYERHRIEGYSVGDNIRFAYGKISKIYPLYLLTTMAMLPFLFMGQGRVAGSRAAVILGLNMLLVENWLPLDPDAINGVAWYLCTCAFTYFLFPWIMRFMERKQTIRKAKISICVLILSQFVIGVIGRQLQDLAFLSGGWFGTGTTRWFVYLFPLTRAVDFLIGCNLGYLYISREDIEKEKIRKWRKTAPILAGGGVIATGMMFVCIAAYSDYGYASQRWWSYTLLFSALSCLLIWLFAANKSKVIGALVNRWTLYFGKVSAYMFLIHNVVLHYLFAAIRVIFSGFPCREQIETCAAFLIGLPLSVICSHIWMKWFQSKTKRPRAKVT